MANRSKPWAVLSSIAWIGWIIAFVRHDRDDSLARHHLNQALALNIIESVGAIISRWGGFFAAVGEVADIAMLGLFIMGIARMSEEPLPLIGGVKRLG